MQGLKNESCGRDQRTAIRVHAAKTSPFCRGLVFSAPTKKCVARSETNGCILRAATVHTILLPAGGWNAVSTVIASYRSSASGWPRPNGDMARRAGVVFLLLMPASAVSAQTATAPPLVFVFT